MHRACSRVEAWPLAMGFAVVLGTITGVGEVVAIASGTWHAMAVTNGGTLMGWGRRSLARDRGALIG